MESKLAICSQIIPNQIMLVGVTKTFTSLYDIKKDTNVNTNLDFLVAHAFVTVSYNNRIDTLTKLVDGIYQSTSVLLEANTVYNLYVYDSLSKQSIKSSVKMLESVNSSIIPRVVKTSSDTEVFVKYKIIDNPVEDNFYLINITNSIPGANIFNIKTDILSQLFNTNNIKLVTDKEAKNGIIENELSNKNDFLGVSSKDTAYVKIASISREYFNFLYQYKRAGSIINQITGEPINMPTNIENGFGFFNAYFPDIYIEDLSKL
jgi:uncharacterized protein YaaR (DUF327 family)